MDVGPASILGQDIVVGKATRKGLNPGGGEGGREDFLHPSRPDVGSTQLHTQWVPGLSPGVEWQKRGFNHAPHLEPRLKKE